MKIGLNKIKTMKAILKKESDGDYILILNNPKEYQYSLPLLSKQNCDEIFGVTDKEIEVEIEMDAIPADRAPGGWDRFLKLDSDGCLILKKIEQ
jgi:hypothetical protein